ncbi:unnamed protein product [Angiostrongylus costaricensis]|uniref:DNA-directed RNA polymerase III subunit RPC3 n=1 Tax=Angiostrongylus costaricensis TaxID=334426 RepID=A0A0R3PFD9_ANGCS|nr:unnamed protein product [Angiostrongylus costaricensis]
MLTEIVPGRETTEELRLLNDLYGTCKQMQLRVLDLIRTVGNEEVTCLLTVSIHPTSIVFQHLLRITGFSTYISNNLVHWRQTVVVENELLVMNDEFNSIFEKYERFMTNRSGERGADVSSALPGPPTGDLIDVGQSEKTLGEQLTGMKVTSSTTDSYSANSEAQVAVGIATVINNKVTESNLSRIFCTVKVALIQNNVTDVEAREMEKWLAAQGQKGL